MEFLGTIIAGTIGLVMFVLGVYVLFAEPGYVLVALGIGLATTITIKWIME